MVYDDPPTEIGECLEIEQKVFMQTANSSILRPVRGVVTSAGHPRRKSLQHFLHLALLNRGSEPRMDHMLTGRMRGCHAEDEADVRLSRSRR
jgi:hypothetical protein